MLLYLEAVSDTPDGLDILGLRGIFLNLLANLLDVYGYGCNIADGIHIPDLTEQFFFGEDMIGMLRQEG